jgi:glyceraldehyde 3-phosphate dehydrogenase
MSEKSFLSPGEDVSDSDVVRVGLNGFGRIGRTTFRAILENPYIDLVGINDVMDNEQREYLARYDSVLGRLDEVELDGETLTIGGTATNLYNVQSPSELPWAEEDIDVAIEATGIFRTKDDAMAHVDAGAGKALLSAPPKGDKPVEQYIYGVNHTDYGGEDVLSAASCTTNSIVPVAYTLLEEFGVNSGLINTIHAYTGSQNLIDGPASKTRRGRAAAENIVPTTTGGATATTEILPELKGKFDGMATRVPLPSGSITDLTVDLEGDPSVEEINEAIKSYADGELEGVMGYTEEPLVSRDIIGITEATKVDLAKTDAVGDGALARIQTWYDNEFSYTSQLVRLAQYVGQQ